MIVWYAVVEVVVSTLAGLVLLVRGLFGKRVDDVGLGALALVELLLIAQLVVSIVAPFVGNHASGNPIEFWAYLVSVLIIPLLAAGWALTDRGRWSSLVLAVAALAVAVMVWRMLLIWTVQGA